MGGVYMKWCGILVAIMILIMVTPGTLALLEFGVEYDSTNGLDANYYSANDFATRMIADGWTQRFLFGNAAAYEKDWKDVTKGGWDDRYADAVDVAFWDGHGSTVGIYPDPPDGTGEVHYSEVNWGDGDMEWMIAHSCLVLDDSHRSDWQKALTNGCHGMLSHKTTCNSVNAGDRLAQLLIAGNTFKDAWFTQHLEKQYSGCVARVIYTAATQNDKLYNHGGWGPDSYPGVKWYSMSCTHP
jgi:hypothetical protein